MKLSNEFTVNTPIERAWTVLTDLEGIAPCLPGAQLTGVQDEVYSGKVRIKVGPVISEFAGTATFVEKDDANYRGVIDAKGRESRAAGNAAALITARLTPEGDRTVVNVDTDLKISGKLAQFGSGMIKEVSGKLLDQFVTALEAKLDAETTVPANGTAPSNGTAPASAVDTPTTLPQKSPAPQPSEPTTDLAELSSVTEPTAVPSPAAAPASAQVPGGAATAAVATGAGAAPTNRVITTTTEPEALDLMSLAGSSVYKRLLPVLAGVAVAAAVVIYVVARR